MDPTGTVLREKASILMSVMKINTSCSSMRDRPPFYSIKWADIIKHILIKNIYTNDISLLENNSVLNNRTYLRLMPKITFILYNFHFKVYIKNFV